MNIISGGVCAAKGFTANGIHCGIRKSRTKKDLSLIFSEKPASCAAVYTTNLVKGAPLLVTKENLSNGIAQAVICYILALILGLQFTVNIIWAILMILVPSFFYIALGLLCGSALTEKQVGGICGALLTNFSAWLSGIWFDVNMLGKAVKTFANALPFIHAVELERAMVLGDIKAALPHLWWVLGYGIVIMVIAVLVFLRQMKRQ